MSRFIPSTTGRPLHSYRTALKAGLAGTAMTVMYAAPASGLGFSFDNGVKGALEVTASYQSMFRVDDMNESGLNPNNDDGNRSFRNTGQVSSLAKVTYDLEFKKKLGSDSTIGLFNRGMAFYDDKIYGASNEHNSPFTLNANAFFGGSLTKLDRFTDDTEDRAGRDAKWLDAFVYLNANSSTDYASTLRVGAQVINWGESLFIQSGIGNAVNPADVSQANLPGTEVKEILLPQKAVYGSIALGDAISLEAYYQWEWTNTIAPPAGTFLSTNDFIAEDGGETLLLPSPGPPLAGLVYTRGRDLNPGDGGQYGLAMRWFAESLNSTDFGFLLCKLQLQATQPGALRGHPHR